MKIIINQLFKRRAKVRRKVTVRTMMVISSKMRGSITVELVIRMKEVMVQWKASVTAVKEILRKIKQRVIGRKKDHHKEETMEIITSICSMCV